MNKTRVLRLFYRASRRFTKQFFYEVFYYAAPGRFIRFCYSKSGLAEFIRFWSVFFKVLYMLTPLYKKNKATAKKIYNWLADRFLIADNYLTPKYAIARREYEIVRSEYATKYATFLRKNPKLVRRLVSQYESFVWMYESLVRQYIRFVRRYKRFVRQCKIFVRQCKIFVSYIKNDICLPIWNALKSFVLHYFFMFWNSFTSTKIGFFLADRYIIPLVEITRLLYAAIKNYRYEFGWFGFSMVALFFAWAYYTFLRHAYFQSILCLGFDWNEQIFFLKSAYERERGLNMSALVKWQRSFHGYKFFLTSIGVNALYLHINRVQKENKKFHFTGIHLNPHPWQTDTTEIDKYLSTRWWPVAWVWNRPWLERFRRVPFFGWFIRPGALELYRRAWFVGKYFEPGPWKASGTYLWPEKETLYGWGAHFKETSRLKAKALVYYHYKRRWVKMKRLYAFDIYGDLYKKNRKRKFKFRRYFLNTRRKWSFSWSIRWVYRKLLARGIIFPWLDKKILKFVSFLERNVYNDAAKIYRKRMYLNRFGTYFVQYEYLHESTSRFIYERENGWTPFFTLYFYRFMRWFLMIGPHG